MSEHRIIAAAAIYKGRMFVGKTHAEVYELCDYAAGGVNTWISIRRNCGWLYSDGQFVRENMDERRRISDGLQRGMDLKMARQFAAEYDEQSKSKLGKLIKPSIHIGEELLYLDNDDDYHKTRCHIARPKTRGLCFFKDFYWPVPNEEQELYGDEKDVWYPSYRNSYNKLWKERTVELTRDEMQERLLKYYGSEAPIPSEATLHGIIDLSEKCPYFKSNVASAVEGGYDIDS